MWHGTALPDELGCDCPVGRPHHTPEYISNPVVMHAREFPAGSSLFFETDFQGSFERITNLESRVSSLPSFSQPYHPFDKCEEQLCLRSKLGYQAPLPYLGVLPKTAHDYDVQQFSAAILYVELPDEPNQGLMLKTKVLIKGKVISGAPCEDAHGQGGPDSSLCLFKLNMPADAPRTLTVTFLCCNKAKDMEFGFYTAYTIPNSNTLEYVRSAISFENCNQMQNKNIEFGHRCPLSRLVEFGMYFFTGVEYQEPLALCQLFNITIKPKSEANPVWTIGGIRLMHRCRAQFVDRRIRWDWGGSVGDNERSTGLPWSRTTGPFSYFTVTLGGKTLGRAYCTEYPVWSQDFGSVEDDKIEAVICGHLFGGGEVTSLSTWISQSEEAAGD